MKFVVSFLCAWLMAGALFLAQDHIQPTWDPPPLPPEAYPGQRTHQRPPEDFFCMRQDITLSVPPQKACTCERMMNPETKEVSEDKHCTVYCHMDKCSCGISGGQIDLSLVPQGVPPSDPPR